MVDAFLCCVVILYQWIYLYPLPFIQCRWSYHMVVPVPVLESSKLRAKTGQYLIMTIQNKVWTLYLILGYNRNNETDKISKEIYNCIGCVRLRKLVKRVSFKCLFNESNCILFWISIKSVLRCPVDNELTLAKVITYCWQVPRYYQNQSSPSSMLLYGVTCAQWINIIYPNVLHFIGSQDDNNSALVQVIWWIKLDPDLCQYMPQWVNVGPAIVVHLKTLVTYYSMLSFCMVINWSIQFIQIVRHSSHSMNNI